MGPYKRNWFVGGTVLLGLVTLGCLIIMFGGSLGNLFAGEKIDVIFKTNRSDGISEGSIIRYLGQQVGVVKNVRLVLDEVPNHVLVQAEIAKNMPIPADSQGHIRVLSPLGGSAIIELVVNPGAEQSAKLQGGETLPLDFAGSGVIPPEVSDLAQELKEAVREFREANVVGSFKAAVDNFNAQVSKAGKVMESIEIVLGDSAVQTDLKTAVAEFRAATTHAKTTLANAERISEELKALPGKIESTMAKVDSGVDDARSLIKDGQARLATTSDQLNRNLAKLAQILDDTKAITAKINTGDGTLALLLNDPKLYDKIVTGTDVINETIKDIQRLVRGFEEDGVPINFK